MQEIGELRETERVISRRSWKQQTWRSRGIAMINVGLQKEMEIVLVDSFGVAHLLYSSAHFDN